ncbi:MAG: hypothetical protein HYR97_00010 [Candidatus Melainabacteria bacterium]|nr:hypothetical protein [Candidatus Melainabacteria bacterium]
MFILQVPGPATPTNVMPRITPPSTGSPIVGTTTPQTKLKDNFTPSSSKPKDGNGPVPTPTNVMPRITPPNTSGGPTVGTNPTMPRSPISDPWQPTLDHIRQNHAIELRGLTRNQTIVGRTMRAVLAGGNNNIQLTYNEDGSYSRPDDTGRYYFQPDGSIFYSGGTITTNTSVVRKGPMTLRNPSNSSSTWDESTTGQRPLTHTYAINQLDLIPDGNGGFTKPGESNSGRYLLQVDGSIFYEGGQLGGNTASAQTYRNNNWHTGGANSSPLRGTMNLAFVRAVPLPDGTWSYRGPGSGYGRGDSVVVHPETGFLIQLTHSSYDQSSGEVFIYDGTNAIRPSTGRLEDRWAYIGRFQVASNGEITFNHNFSDSEYNRFNQIPVSFIIDATRLIRQSRATRNWRPPS